ncbi:Uncharacterised protein [Vibrio cholerae]|uniref:Uncharacterized protein n=1 Tax=Vibrio cholerae TaxID=666 RepID=A0A655VXW5_VIBCL|nr:Uncharacterised protein [Vibrio cholerae]
MPAAVTIAVPCWSSWNTGTSQRSIRRRSISKQSGALISSKLMPPKVSAMLATVSINSSMVRCFTSISIESNPAKRLNSSALPSMTGLEAIGPKFPNPKIAVPLEITATVLPFAVYLYTLSTFCAISRTGSATPGL